MTSYLRVGCPMPSIMINLKNSSLSMIFFLEFFCVKKIFDFL
jgi:hypothetical protein